MTIPVIGFTQPIFYRSYNVSVGFRDSLNSEIEWVVKNESTNILMSVTEDKLEIYSKTKKQYRTIGMISEDEKNSVWIMVDSDNKKCAVIIGNHADTNIQYLQIEYNDSVILYFIKPD